MKKFTVELTDDLYEWLKNYQYTLDLVMDRSMTLQELAREIFQSYKDKINLDIQERPLYIRRKEERHALSISNSRKKSKD